MPPLPIFLLLVAIELAEIPVRVAMGLDGDLRLPSLAK